MSVQALPAREVPLGGVRAITVRRTLPHRERSFVGAWCFADHYAPHRVGPDNAGGMNVPPHPHTGLSTVSWLFEGTVSHRDANGVVAQVRPGEMNLMTAGHGICHSEVSTHTQTLHGVQLWVALPNAHRDTDRDFQHHVPAPVDLPGGGGTARVFIGELAGVDASPVTMFTSLLGAQLDLAPGARVELDLTPGFEHAYLLDTGALTVDGTPIASADLAIIDPGPPTVTLEAGAEGARLLMLGGEPFTDEVVMWWNFMAPDREGILRAREEWEAHSDRFGAVGDYDGKGSRLPAPPIPGVRLKPRRLHHPEPPAAS